MINLQAEGKKGNGIREIGEKGFVRIDVQDKQKLYFISCDGYEGRGSSYKKRRETQVVVGTKDELFEFNSFQDLLERLRGEFYVVHEKNINDSDNSSIHHCGSLSKAIETILTLIEDDQGDIPTKIVESIQKAPFEAINFESSNYEYLIEKVVVSQ